MRSLWHQTNDKYNVYVEKENPGPGLYKSIKKNSSCNPINSAFNSKTIKLPERKILNNNVSYLVNDVQNNDMKPDSLTRETREMRWTFDKEVPFTKPDN